MRTALATILSVALVVLGAVAVFGADPSATGLDLVGGLVMSVGIAGLTLVGLVWAARGPGSVQQARAHRGHRDRRRHAWRLTGPRAR